MDNRVTHPSKEQIRAYMTAREHAHKPPPAPDEIRRQLGWQLISPGSSCPLFDLCLFPATIGQIAAGAAFNLYLAATFGGAPGNNLAI